MDVDSAIATRNPTSQRRHEKLWFTDGSVVLATDQYLFRVHKSVLSMQSSVFKDMFDLNSDNVQGSGGRGSGITQEMYEEVPLVTLTGDKGRDVAHLLSAVYDRSYYDKENDETPLEVILALLTLSAKYDFDLIKRDVVTHLRSIYPDTLKDYDDNERIYNHWDLRQPLFGEDSKLDCDIALLQAAFSNNIEIILPALFYSCCTNGAVKLPAILLRYPDLLTRNKDCAERMVSGHEVLSDQYHFIARKFAEGFARCASTHPAVPDVDMYGLEHLMDTAHYLFTRSDLETYLGNHEVEICAECRRAILANIESEREKLWTEIPDVFRLPSWRVLRERYDV